MMGVTACLKMKTGFISSFSFCENSSQVMSEMGFMANDMLALLTSTSIRPHFATILWWSRPRRRVWRSVRLPTRLCGR